MNHLQFSMLLYAEKDDAGSLDACVSNLSLFVWAVDMRRDPEKRRQDMLQDEPCSTMCTLAAAGLIRMRRPKL